MNKKLNKQIIVPILSAIALIIKYASGFEIPDAAIDLTADVILGVNTLIGIFLHPVKEGKSSDAQHSNTFESNQ